MQEDGRLGHLGLFQVLVRAIEHNVGDAVAKNVVGFVEKFLGFRIGFV